MENFDGITIEILPDGTIKTVTDGVSGANHSNAEQFLRLIASMSNSEGTYTRTKRVDVNQRLHVHSHGEHEHSH